MGAEPVRLRFRVASEGESVLGARVVLAGDEWSLFATTDTQGEVAFDVSLADLELIPPTLESVLYLGSMRVTASKLGYLAAVERRLDVIDCSVTALERTRTETVTTLQRELEALLASDLPSDPRGLGAFDPTTGPAAEERTFSALSRTIHIVAELDGIASAAASAGSPVRDTARTALQALGLGFVGGAPRGSHG
jgi:hypothetical protein